MKQILLVPGLLVIASIACNFSATEQGAETEAPAPPLAPALTEAPVLTEEPIFTEEPTVLEEADEGEETSTALPSPTLPPPTDEPTATSETEEVLQWPIVKQGDSGPVVEAAQYLLSSSGYFLSVDGIFGPETRGEVMEFQSDNGLVSDGIIGPMTWLELISGHTLNQGDNGRDVRGLQTLLRARGYNEVDVDGIFGPITRNAVEDFQAKSDLDVDGIVGPITWNALISLPFFC